ncbi:MAG: nicotinate phosphoribosyltransferase [Candidatus Tectomicrobia bacterium]|nr:nicotinate phosphoribosyltransferase [Candidatus Tectomicrobia bacterium]
MTETFHGDNFQTFLTDLYELTMAAAYYHHQIDHLATFELFVRNLPPQRSYLMVAGLEQAIDYLQHLHFNDDQIEFLRKHPLFKDVNPRFFDYLKTLCFTGDVWAMPEGTIAFAEEPLLRVTAPVIEAQIVETFLLSMINFQTAIATKASRVVTAAQGRGVIEFGSRRAHGPEAAVLAARASYIAGCIGTSNVYAGYKFGIPIFGTIAHSWVMTFDQEEESFSRYFQAFPDSTTLLIDTYDTLEGARRATAIGSKLRGVRLDSGDLLTLSREVRRILDQAGLQHAGIVASGDLNEYLIDELIRNSAPINTFGVGTEMATSKDAPALGGVYKLVEQMEGEKEAYRIKLSEKKATYPGKKQVFRLIDDHGHYLHDIIAREVEAPPSHAFPLLEPFMEKGEIVSELPSLTETRERAKRNLESLPHQYRRLEHPESYPIHKSQALEALLESMRRET